MLCRGAATTPAGQGPPTQPAPTPARTDFSGPDPTPPNPVAPSVNPSSASVSPRAAPTTLVFSSGAVLTVSGMQTTLTAGLTTLTQPAGATRTLPSASSGPGGEASNDAARRSRDMMPMLVAAGLVAYAWL
ncbi:hypothetical protein FRC08_016582 [Ceratobasidium sp. 394]|nr:hypothetical protein FRC08_016582 [Ceratobasidium sp. 394]